jgi:hypothetical protein
MLTIKIRQNIARKLRIKKPTKEKLGLCPFRPENIMGLAK